ncbi:hypothetical protein [Carbonactinospora thermoautotrophica]|uniref:hypothetical protein n=1 Tax=Carbonactinospora thermoautotrophica TaxID=1469144 RepID=UPI0014952899|nr:hypothetical protein [Carbonactinospora thermoautotrophica]
MTTRTLDAAKADATGAGGPCGPGLPRHRLNPRPRNPGDPRETARTARHPTVAGERPARAHRPPARHTPPWRPPPLPPGLLDRGQRLAGVLREHRPAQRAVREYLDILALGTRPA